MLMKLRLEESAPDDWSLTIVEIVPLGFIYNFCVEEQLVMICKLGGELAKVAPVIKQLELSYPAPSHHALYQRYFKGPIIFNARCTRITLCSPRLDQALRGNNKEFSEMCARQCEMLLRQIGQQSPLAAKIKNILMRSRGRNPGIEAVASDLHISPRTLRRHLQVEGVNFQNLVNEFRVDMAKEYLQSVSITTKEIAYLLGFQDTNSFRRAFKTWTGKTVQEYRAKEP